MVEHAALYKLISPGPTRYILLQGKIIASLYYKCKHWDPGIGKINCYKEVDKLSP
jgi:hypothetical protein